MTKVRMVHLAGTDQEHCEEAYIELGYVSYVGVKTRASRVAVGSEETVLAYPITLGPHDMWIVDGPWREALVPNVRQQPTIWPSLFKRRPTGWLE